MSAALFVLAAPATLRQDIRKSIFVANAAEVTSVDAALAFVASVSDRTATHNCWAYRVGQQYRFSDDGEPGGTAGKPILQAIDGQRMDCTAVVVTRWYGGIKLGAGGLARAYGGCAAECLRLAAKNERIALCAVEFFLPFAALPLLRARLAEFSAAIADERFDADGAALRLDLPAARVDALRIWVTDATRGRSTLKRLD
ncbi:MAG: YigZ family protein [Rudaea sp.]|uniref:IMPACT family protein n=1 Tax=unclassified Rudaea TaxID=2627037 RepID=UPI0010F9EA0F|nr:MULTISPECIES: YigZ family protein [unclassified Rudaea]MBN8888207.1 YigZ family protein [Rudaea sp.]